MEESGFTLVELLVVVGIIARLAALISVSFVNSRQKARDARRVSDLSSLTKALALYANINQQYPSTGGLTVTLTGGDPVSLALTNAGVISMMPADPISSGNYVYSYVSADGSGYTLRFCLETDSIKGYSEGCGNAISQ